MCHVLFEWPLICYDPSNAYCNSEYSLSCPTELCHFPDLGPLSSKTFKNILVTRFPFQASRTCGQLQILKAIFVIFLVSVFCLVIVVISRESQNQELDQNRESSKVSHQVLKRNLRLGQVSLVQVRLGQVRLGEVR